MAERRDISLGFVAYGGIDTTMARETEYKKICFTQLASHLRYFRLLIPFIMNPRVRKVDHVTPLPSNLSPQTHDTDSSLRGLRLSRVLPNLRFKPTRKEAIWFTQGSKWGNSNFERDFKREKLASKKHGATNGKESSKVISEKEKGESAEVNTNKKRIQIQYKEFDWFSSPDLPEITSKLVEPESGGLSKSVYVILVLSTVGFVYQAWSVLSQYFSYETVTVLAIIMPNVLTAPAISICFPYAQVINQRKVLRSYPDLAEKPFNLTTLGAVLTIADIFQMTPKADVDKTVASCAFRTPDSPQLFETNLCDGVMDMSKFFKQQFVCYDVSLVTKTGFRYRNIRNSLSSAGQSTFSFVSIYFEPFLGLFYEVRLTPHGFDRIKTLQLVIHEPGVMPRGNKAYPVS